MAAGSLVGEATVCHYSSHYLWEDGGVNRTERLHALSESLRRAGARGRTADQLAEEFEVTSRTTALGQSRRSIRIR
jgi:hypothetical protein